MRHFRRQLILFSVLAALGVAPVARAQDFPSKTITIVVPFSAGGGVDTVARLLAEKLRGSLKQNVIVDNKAGGSGMVISTSHAAMRPENLSAVGSTLRELKLAL